MKRFLTLTVAILLYVLNINAQKTYVFSTTTRSSLPITINVNGRSYRLDVANEYPKPGTSSCVTVTINGSMQWEAIDCDGDRMEKFERNPVHDDSGNVAYIHIRLIGTTKVHKNRPTTYQNNNNNQNRSTTQRQNQNLDIGSQLTSFAGDLMNTIINLPTASQYLVNCAMNGDPIGTSLYGKVTFWGGENCYKGEYGDIPMNHTHSLNCHYICNKEYKKDLYNAEIAYMVGMGMGIEPNEELAEEFLEQARQCNQQDIADLVEAELLLHLYKQDTLRAVELILKHKGTKLESVLNGNLPVFSPIYTGYDINSYIYLMAELDLVDAIWYGCDSLKRRPQLAEDIIKQISEVNRGDGFVSVLVGNKIAAYRREFRDVDITPAIGSLNAALECPYKSYQQDAHFTLGCIYAYFKECKDKKKALYHLKKARKNINYKEFANSTIEMLKKEK